MSRATTKLALAWSRLRASLAMHTLSPNLPRTPTQPHHPFDRRYGTDTGGFIPGPELRTGHPHDAFNTAYYGMAPSRFQAAVEHWIPRALHPAPAAYSFIDLGCGKGRALMLATALPFRQAIGVELHPALARIADANLALWSRTQPALCPVTILCQDAAGFLFPPGPCLLYLFHPFTAPVLRKVIARIEAQFAHRPGSLDILYFNPESADLFAAHSGFELLWTGPLPASEEDTAADPLLSPNDLCSLIRWTGSSPLP